MRRWTRSTSARRSVALAHLNRRSQHPRGRAERRWATRAVRVATGAESASSALQREGADPTKLAQVAHGAAHVVTQCPAYSIEALRVVQLEHCHASLGVDAKVNECAEVSAPPPARTMYQRLRLN